MCLTNEVLKPACLNTFLRQCNGLSELLLLYLVSGPASDITPQIQVLTKLAPGLRTLGLDISMQILEFSRKSIKVSMLIEYIKAIIPHLTELRQLALTLLQFSAMGQLDGQDNPFTDQLEVVATLPKLQALSW